MGGGIDEKFWTFNGWEKATKIEQVQRRQKLWSFGDNVIIESPHSLPMKRNLPSENQKIHQPFQHVFKAKLILIAKTSAPGQYTDSGFAQYRLE